MDVSVGRTDPISGQALTSNALIPNISFRNAIRQYLDYVAMVQAAFAAAAAATTSAEDTESSAEIDIE